MWQRVMQPPVEDRMLPDLEAVILAILGVAWLALAWGGTQPWTVHGRPRTGAVRLAMFACLLGRRV